MDENKKNELMGFVKAYNNIDAKFKKYLEKYFSEQEAFIKSNPFPDWDSLEKNLQSSLKKGNLNKSNPKTISPPQDDDERNFYRYAQEYYDNWLRVLEELWGRPIEDQYYPMGTTRTSVFHNFIFTRTYNENSYYFPRLFDEDINFRFPPRTIKCFQILDDLTSLGLFIQLDFSVVFSELNNIKEFNLIVYGFNSQENKRPNYAKAKYTKRICSISTVDQWVKLGYPDLNFSGYLGEEETKQMKRKIEILFHNTIKEFINKGL